MQTRERWELKTGYKGTVHTNTGEPVAVFDQPEYAAQAIKAVNSHDALVKALRETVSLLEQMGITDTSALAALAQAEARP